MRDEITRIQANQIANDFLGNRGRKTHGEVLAYSEVSRLTPYTENPISWADCWIVYCDPGEEILIRSRDIVAISKITGEVLYFGSANEEG